MALLQLPPELLLRMSFYLTTPELGNLRRSCKHISAVLLDSFSKEFFTKKQFMIEHVSLKALVDIANHPIFSQQLSEVIIGLRIFTNDPDLEWTSSKQRYLGGQVTRSILLETGQARDMLVEAFSKLPNLRIVGLRDYEARGRYRDGLDACWRSYGWTYGQNAGPTFPYLHAGYDSSNRAVPDATLPLLLYALGCAHAKPQAIEVFLRKRAKLSPASFNVLDDFMGAKVIPVLAGLKRLMLTIAFNEYSPYGAPWLPYNDDDDGVRNVFFKRLLHHMSNLETLRLNFDETQFLAYRLLEWLGKPVLTVATATVPNNPSLTPVSLPTLRGLDLGMLNTPGPVLVNVITKFDLLYLNLWKVTIHCKDKSEVKQEPDRWAQFLNDLSDALPDSTRLKSVMVGYAAQGWYSEGDETSVRVHFNPEGHSPGRQSRADNPDKVTYRASYGSSVKDWLRGVSTRTSIDTDDESSIEGSDDGDDSENSLDNESGMDDDDEDDDEL